MFHIAIDSPGIEIQANTLQELEERLGLLNPLCLSRMNTILKRKYGLIANGSGVSLQCIPYSSSTSSIQVVVIYPNGQNKDYLMEPKSQEIKHTLRSSDAKK